MRTGQEHSNDLYSVKLLYQFIGTGILIIAIAFFFVKVPQLLNPHPVSEAEIGNDLFSGEKQKGPNLHHAGTLAFEDKVYNVGFPEEII